MVVWPDKVQAANTTAKINAVGTNLAFVALRYFFIRGSFLGRSSKPENEKPAQNVRNPKGAFFSFQPAPSARCWLLRHGVQVAHEERVTDYSSLRGRFAPEAIPKMALEIASPAEFTLSEVNVQARKDGER